MENVILDELMQQPYSCIYSSVEEIINDIDDTEYDLKAVHQMVFSELFKKGKEIQYYNPSDIPYSEGMDDDVTELVFNELQNQKEFCNSSVGQLIFKYGIYDGVAMVVIRHSEYEMLYVEKSLVDNEEA